MMICVSILKADLSDHTSDEQIYEGDRSDDEYEYHDAESGPTTSIMKCECGLCPQVHTEDCYCCNEISVAVKMSGEKKCIVQIEQFGDCIENTNALEMAAFALSKRKPFPQRSEVEKFNRLMRYTSYKTFLDILEFRGMGIGNRYRLPACVENRIRGLYPCPKGQYTGFIGLGQAGTLKNY